jgi:hypothetical protein
MAWAGYGQRGVGALLRRASPPAVRGPLVQRHCRIGAAGFLLGARVAAGRSSSVRPRPFRLLAARESFSPGFAMSSTIFQLSLSSRKQLAGSAGPGGIAGTAIGFPADVEKGGTASSYW